MNHHGCFCCIHRMRAALTGSLLFVVHVGYLERFECRRKQCELFGARTSQIVISRSSPSFCISITCVYVMKTYLISEWRFSFCIFWRSASTLTSQQTCARAVSTESTFFQIVPPRDTQTHTHTHTLSRPAEGYPVCLKPTATNTQKQIIFVHHHDQLFSVSFSIRTRSERGRRSTFDFFFHTQITEQLTITTSTCAVRFASSPPPLHSPFFKHDTQIFSFYFSPLLGRGK